MKYKYNNQWIDINIKALDSMPIGSIIAFAGTTIPNGWLECNGSAVSRTTYADLFAVIGTTYGTGNGSTTFNLPNLKGRVPVGYDSSQTEFDTMGETGGSKALQSHTHSGLKLGANGKNLTFNGSGSGSFYSANLSAYDVGGDALVTQSAGTGNSGNLQPYIVEKYIIKAFNVVPTMAGIVNANSTSSTDGYSCSYINTMKSNIDAKLDMVIVKNKDVNVNWSSTGWQQGSFTHTAPTGYTLVNVQTYGVPSADANGVMFNINGNTIYYKVYVGYTNSGAMKVRLLYVKDSAIS